jgi:hypothetical protein
MESVDSHCNVILRSHPCAGGQRGYPEPINRYGYQHNMNPKPEPIVCGLMAVSNPIFYRAWLERRMLTNFESMGTLPARLLKSQGLLFHSSTHSSPIMRLRRLNLKGRATQESEEMARCIYFDVFCQGGWHCRYNFSLV